MIDISILRRQPEVLKAALARRGLELDVDTMAQTDQARRNLRAQAERTRAEQNGVSRRISRLEGEPRQAAIARAGTLARQYRSALAEADERDKDFEELWIKVPNLADPSAAYGFTDEDSLELKRWGEVPETDYPLKDHRELGAALGMIDIERAAKVSGSRFGYLTGPAVIIEFGLVRMALDFLGGEGFTPVVPPVPGPRARAVRDRFLS